MSSWSLAFLSKRAKELWHHEGPAAFFRGGFDFIWASFKELFVSQFNGTYYIYEKILSNLDESVFNTKSDDSALVILSDPKQVEDLIAEGYDIDSHFETRNLKKMIGHGAMLFCIFGGKELAHHTLVALTKEAKGDIDILPYEVDFQTEAIVGHHVTIPRFQRRGYLNYTTGQIYRFLKDRGYLKAKFSVPTKIISVQRNEAKLGSKIIGEGRYLSILFWKSWRAKAIS